MTQGIGHGCLELLEACLFLDLSRRSWKILVSAHQYLHLLPIDEAYYATPLHHSDLSPSRTPARYVFSRIPPSFDFPVSSHLRPSIFCADHVFAQYHA